MRSIFTCFGRGVPYNTHERPIDRTNRLSLLIGYQDVEGIKSRLHCEGGCLRPMRVHK